MVLSYSIILIVILLLGIFFYSSSIRTIDKRFWEQNETTLTQTASDLNYTLEMMDVLCGQIGTSAVHSLTYYVNGIVPKTSFKCICNQENQILNLKDGKSTIWPNLLIDNYDVDSNHGAYIGKFNEEKIFYMMSRGLSYEEANRLLLNGFLLNSDSIDLNQISDFVEEIEKI